jgi:hypothetical protein
MAFAFMRPQYIVYCPHSQAHKEGLEKIFCAVEVITIVDRAIKTSNNRTLNWNFSSSCGEVLGGALVSFLK